MTLLIVGALWPRRRLRDLEPKIVHLTDSDIDCDIRIDKYVRSLVAHGFETHVLGCDEALKTNRTYSANGATYTVVPMRPRPLGRWWKPEQCREAVKLRAAIYHANDLSSLLTALVAARINGAKLIYDAHEIWSENVDFDPSIKAYVRYRWPKRIFLTVLEGLLCRKADLFMTVNEPIAEHYRRKFRLARRPLVVRNVPLVASFPEVNRFDLKSELGVPQGTFVLGYIGGVGPSRNIEAVIESLKYLKDLEVVFFVMGPKLGLFMEEYRSLAKLHGAENRLIMREGVAMSEVPRYMSSLDAGILMLRNLCLNFYFFLPNKLFEYMGAGIPILASDFPVVGPIVRDHRLGEVFDPHRPEDIAQAIRRLVSAQPGELKKMGERGRELISHELNWEKESVPYLDSVESFFSESGLKVSKGFEGSHVPITEQPSL